MNERPILLVEDNPDDVWLTIDALKANNISNEMVVARDGVEAMDYLFGEGIYAHRNPRDLPALVLLDLNMPKISGLEVLSRIRTSEHTQLLPVIILTSSDEDKDKIDGYQLGANSYVRKPVDFKEFVKAAGQLGLYWLLLNEWPPSR